MDHAGNPIDSRTSVQENELLMKNQLARMNYQVLFWSLLSLVVLVGFHKGVLIETGSKDLQYYPSKLLFEGIDYYTSYLNAEAWFLSQYPNYYFHLHYILSPFTTLSWFHFKLFWFVLNVSLLIVLFNDIRSRYQVSYATLTLYLLPLVVGFPLTNTLGNGQFGVVVLALLYFSWVCREKPGLLAVFLFLLFAKYSFGVPLLFGFLLMGYFRAVVYATLLILVFPVLYSVTFGLDLLETLFLPLKVSSLATGIGVSDVMSLSRLLFEDTIHQLLFVAVINLTLVLILIYYAYKKRVSSMQLLVCSILFSFVGFFHHGYDWVVLILLLFYLKDGLLKQLFYAYILLLFTYPRVENHLGIDWLEMLPKEYSIAWNVCVLGTLFFITLNDSNQQKIVSV